jgi:hypothetical protein
VIYYRGFGGPIRDISCYWGEELSSWIAENEFEALHCIYFIFHFLQKIFHDLKDEFSGMHAEGKKQKYQQENTSLTNNDAKCEK